MLVAQRLEWLANYKQGGKPSSKALEDYRRYRLSEAWRVSSVIEELCEYILHLEGLQMCYHVVIINESKQTSVQLNQSPVSYTQAVQLLALYTEKGFETKSLVRVNK